MSVFIVRGVFLYITMLSAWHHETSVFLPAAIVASTCWSQLLQGWETKKTNECAMQDRKAFPLCIKSCCQFLIGMHLLPFPTVGTAMADFYTSTSLLLFLGACENALQLHSSLLASFRECCRCFQCLWVDCPKLCSLFYSRQAQRLRGGLELWIAIPANKWRRVYTWG